ncbi:modification methylase [Campylobacter upsaliensis]|nr:modification methylase [Campylobacter upsaliensis]
MEKILELDLAKQDNENLKLFEKNLSKLQEKIFFLKADEPQEQTLFEITEDNELNNAGDFRSKDCIELLKLADIVVTNPPFSLFREYVAQLVEYDKKFLIIGNVNAITYKDTFDLIKDNKLWLGVSITSGDRKFYVPDSTPLNAAGCGVEKVIQNGKEVERRFIRVKGVRWFSNLENKKRNEILETISSYKKNPEQYPKYDNYDAINVDKTIEIPLDYDGIMGVPITFLDKHNPKQFEILSCHEPAILLETLKQMPKFKEYKSRQIIINGRVCQKTYHRIFIRKIAEVGELRKLEFEKM